MNMVSDCLYEYRVSKYSRDPNSGMPLEGQWTSISDVGKIFCGKVLTYEEYINTENQYLTLIERVCETTGITQLQIKNLEDYQHLAPHPNLFWTNKIEQIKTIARDCLREKYWCKLQTHNLFIHFGYDYYLYIGVPFDCTQMIQIAGNTGLFVDQIPSPYKDKDKTGDGSLS